MLGFFFYTNG